MPHPLLIALIAFVAIPLMARADETKQSPAVKRILEDTARKVRTNRQAFDKANEKPLAEARKALEELSTKLIKDGKAEEATAVLKQVGTLDADVMRMANAPAPVGGGAVPQRPLLERMAGRWDHPNSPVVMVCDATGRVKETFKKDGAFFHQGTLRILEHDSLEARFPTRFYKIKVISEDLVAVRVYNLDGSEMLEGVLKERVP